MTDRLLEEKRKALEEAFFPKAVYRSIEKIRLARDREAQIAEMTKASGASDRTLLEHILDLGIDTKTFWALTLTPLVAVAWADGSVSPKEREAILRAAEGRGVTSDSPIHLLLEKWMDQR